MWFAEEFKRIQVDVKYLDYSLAVYCIAKHLPLLPIGKWKLLFNKRVKDEDVDKTFAKMRGSYLVIHKDYPPTEEPTEGKKTGWANHVLMYVKKLFQNGKTQGVAILLAYQLLCKCIHD